MYLRYSMKMFFFVAFAWFIFTAAEAKVVSSAPATPQVVESGSKGSNVANDALWAAIRNNDPSAVRSSIKRGGNVERKGVGGWTSLHLAAVHGYVGVADELLKAGANTGARDDYNNQPIHIAAFTGKDEVVSRLAKAGADINAVGGGGMTPIQWATKYDRNSTVALLSSLGAHQ